MTNFQDLTSAWQQLHGLAPEAFAPINTDADLHSATDFLRALDREMGEAAGHLLAPLADALMYRIQLYEAAHFPVPDADGPMMLAFYLDQKALTQQQLSAQTGIRQSTLSLLLNRKRPFTAAHARALGEYFGVAAGMFL